jgi:PPP family 3-phenylpropionic acid transporter
VGRFLFYSSLFFALYFGFMGIYIIRLPLYFHQHLHLSPTQIGVLFGAMPLAKFLTPFLFLRRGVNWGEFWVGVGIGLLGALLLFSTHYWLLLIGFFLLGVSFSIIPPYLERRAVEVLGHRYGRARLFGSLGFVVAGGVPLPEGLYLPIGVGLIFGALWAGSKIVAPAEEVVEEGHLSLLRGWHFWLSLILVKSAAAGYYSFFTIYLHQHNLDQYVGLFWGVAIGLEVTLFLLQPQLLSKISPETAMGIGIGATALRWFLLYLFPDNFWWVLFSQTLHACTFALYHIGALLYLSNLYPNRKTLAQQLYGGLGYGFSFFLGSWLAGLFYGPNLFLYEGGLTLVGLGLFLLGEFRRRSLSRWANG